MSSHSPTAKCVYPDPPQISHLGGLPTDAADEKLARGVAFAVAHNGLVAVPATPRTVVRVPRVMMLPPGFPAVELQDRGREGVKNRSAAWVSPFRPAHRKQGGAPGSPHSKSKNYSYVETGCFSDGPAERRGANAETGWVEGRAPSARGEY